MNAEIGASGREGRCVMGIFGKSKPNAGKIRSTKAGRVLDDAKRDVARKDEVAARRAKKQGRSK